ncbi:hypothetical protein BGZ65_008562 [Modicella reniformis]|uniref:Uncharacterized protein n=1 Tax=Modicella reniformis TaxID=1440133 RepID=A0A9P6SP33_9FUNG|nr:hypothetical protein BGZ65_008562 [Modicella reniformis]
MAVDLSRKRALQDLISQRQQRKQNTTNTTSGDFPSLFQLTIRACITHLQIFASFDGLPFYPFGQALYEEFAHRSTQWRLTTEQRQAGVFLFAEAYGDEFLGPEYTGLRCSLAHDIPFLGSFGKCLVYLDLSGGCACASRSNSSSRLDGGGGMGDFDRNADSIGFSDKDMAGLSALSHLRILNLAHLRIGDTGLGHLVRSVTFGSSGPARLEYLNLSGTNVTDVGFAKLFIKQQQLLQEQQRQKQHQSMQTYLAFEYLLGIDVSDSKVHDEVAEKLFRTTHSSVASWRRLSDKTLLFADLTAKEQRATKTRNTQYFVEQETGVNPMQIWVDRLNRTYKLSFGQRPDLAGEDGLGITECLAFAKMGQVYLLPLPEPLTRQRQEYQRRGDEFRLNALLRRTRLRKEEVNVHEIMESMKSEGKGKNTPQAPPSELEHMFNLTMYQKVLSSVQSTFGIKHQSKSTGVTETGYKRRLAFVRSRTDISKQQEDFGVDDGDQLQFNQFGQEVTGPRSTGGTAKAKIRNRHIRFNSNTISAPIDPKMLPTLSAKTLLSEDHSHLDTTSSLSSPFSKKARTSASSFIKQGCTSTEYDHLPGRRRSAGGPPNPFRPANQPFAKPMSEQAHTGIFITQPTTITRQPSASSSTPSTSTESSMNRWINQARPTVKLTPLPGKKRGVPGMDRSNRTSTRRESYFHEAKEDVISLDRWIRSGPLDRNGTNVREENGSARKVIRFDPKHELFADGDSS